MLTPEIKAKISSGSSDSSGRMCNYYRLNENQGLKVWHYQETRDKCYDAQKLCEEIGLAPALGEKVEIPVRGEMLYGYVTEHLETVLDWINKNCKECTEEWYEAYERANEQVGVLQGIYEAEKIAFQDACLFNIGIMANGNWCAIDFGDVYKY